MKKELQKLKSDLEDEMKRAKELMNGEYMPNHHKNMLFGEFMALFKVIDKLTLLLDSENEKSSQSSQEDGSNSSNAM